MYFKKESVDAVVKKVLGEVKDDTYRAAVRQGEKEVHLVVRIWVLFVSTAIVTIKVWVFMRGNVKFMYVGTKNGP